MRKYYKAYYLKDFRQFSQWTEKNTEDKLELTDETICYLGDDFVVVSSPVQDKDAIFNDVTPAWRDFCTTTLHFEVPGDLRSASAHSEQANTGSEVTATAV